MIDIRKMSKTKGLQIQEICELKTFSTLNLDGLKILNTVNDKTPQNMLGMIFLTF